MDNIFKEIKLITIIFIVLSIVFIISTSALYIILAREKIERNTLQNELADVMKERKKLSIEIEELKLIKGDLEVKVSGLETQAKALTEDYEKEKSQNDVIRAELTEKAKGLEEAGEKLKAAKTEKEKLQELFDSEKARYDQLKERVNKLVEVKDVLEEKVRDIINKQGIELERIVIKAEGELEGRVLVVNREFNFIVVNIGMDDDIEIGNYITIFRNGKYVGEAQIEKIYDTMSAATIIKEIKPRAIMVDDNVIVRGN